MGEVLKDLKNNRIGWIKKHEDTIMLVIVVVSFAVVLSDIIVFSR